MYTKNLPDNTQFVIMKTDWCEPTQTYIPRMNCPDWGGWGGANESDGYPATRPIFPTSDSGSKLPATRWPSEWVKYFKHLNITNLRDSFDIANGIINNVNGQVQVEPPYDIDALEEMPKLENISCVGSIHIAEGRTDERVRIRTWHYWDMPNFDLNFRNSVGIVKFTGIMRDTGILINLYSGATDCYWPLCIRDGEAWIDQEEVEYFPELGWITIGNRDLIARSGPEVRYSQVGVLYKEASVPITRYHPSGYDVWGRVGVNQGDEWWIPLRYQTTFGSQKYLEPTSWHLETIPGCKPWQHTIPGEYGYVSPFAEEVPPEEDEMLFEVEVVVDVLNVRGGPSTAYSVLYTIRKGETYPVYEERDGWVRIGTHEWCAFYDGKYVKKIEPPPTEPTFKDGQLSILNEMRDWVEQKIIEIS